MSEETSALDDILHNGYSGQIITCPYCGSQAVTYYWRMRDAQCRDCGLWLKHPNYSIRIELCKYDPETGRHTRYDDSTWIEWERYQTFDEAYAEFQKIGNGEL